MSDLVKLTNIFNLEQIFLDPTGSLDFTLWVSGWSNSKIVILSYLCYCEVYSIIVVMLWTSKYYQDCQYCQ